MKNLIRNLVTIVLLAAVAQIFTFAQETKDSVDVNKIIDKYIDAIGGKDALSKIEDRTTIMRGTAMGQSITVIEKQKTPNKMRQEFKVAAMEQVILFDGEKGVMQAAGQKIDVTGKELEQLKIQATLDFVLNHEKYGVKSSYLTTEKISEKDAHKIKLTLPSGLNWVEYYDVETGLKIKEQRVMETQGQTFEQVITYDNYTEVEGVKYPFKVMQSIAGQDIDMTVSSVKVNKGIKDDIFVISE